MPNQRDPRVPALFNRSAIMFCEPTATPMATACPPCADGYHHCNTNGIYLGSDGLRIECKCICHREGKL